MSGVGGSGSGVGGEARGSDVLVIVHGKPSSRLGERFVLDRDRVRVGRDEDNDITIDCDDASRHHASFVRSEGAWWIVDNGSSNGTYLNGTEISSKRQLTHGDRVKVGSLVFEYHAGQREA